MWLQTVIRKKKKDMQEALGLTNKFNWKNCAPFGNCNILIRRRHYCVWSNVTGLIEPPKACLIKDLKSSIWQPIKTRKSWKQLFLILSVLCFQVHYVWTHYIQHWNEVLDKAMSTIVLFSGQITCDIRVVSWQPLKSMTISCKLDRCLLTEVALNNAEMRSVPGL